MSKAFPEIKKFWQFVFSHYGFNLFARWHQHVRFKRFGGIGRRRGAESCKMVFLGGTPYCSVTFCCRMYRLSTESQTDGRTRCQYNEYELHSYLL